MAKAKSPDNEDPKDGEHLAALREARKRGDEEGEKKAIALLVASWSGRAESYLAYRGVTREDRQEILSVWTCKLVAKLKEAASFPFPFKVIAMRRIEFSRAEHFRARHRHEEVIIEELGEFPEVTEDFDPDEGLVLAEALGRLEERDRQVIELTFIEDRSGAEAGEILGKNEIALRTAKSRALEKLREKMRELGVTE